MTDRPSWPPVEPSGPASYGAPPAPTAGVVQGSMPNMAQAPAFVPNASERPMTTPPRRGWIVALVAVILAFVLMLFAFASCAQVAGRAMMPFASSTQTAASRESVGVITISGTIDYNGTTASPEGLREQLAIARDDPLIRAVVLRVNSGGGSATAGEEMAAYVRDFEKPIVVSSAAMNASAAYEISSQADYIFTAHTTAIGAIGTAMQLTDLSGLLAQLGITIDNITSSESKDSSYGTRPITEEERAYYQSIVDSVNNYFVETVAAGRSMDIDAVRALATGLTFTGDEAVENGLADEIGLLENAIDKAAELAHIDDPATVNLRSSDDSLSQLLDVLGSVEGSGQDEAIGSRVIQ